MTASGFSVRKAIRPRLRLTGPIRLAARLAARDIRHRPGTGLLLLLVALLTATTTMTLALVARGSAEKPWDQTFTATRGPHVVATTFAANQRTDAAMADLAERPEGCGRDRPSTRTDGGCSVGRIRPYGDDGVRHGDRPGPSGTRIP